VWYPEIRGLVPMLGARDSRVLPIPATPHRIFAISCEVLFPTPCVSSNSVLGGEGE